MELRCLYASECCWARAQCCEEWLDFDVEMRHFVVEALQWQYLSVVRLLTSNALRRRTIRTHSPGNQSKLFIQCLPKVPNMREQTKVHLCVSPHEVFKSKEDNSFRNFDRPDLVEKPSADSS